MVNLKLDQEVTTLRIEPAVEEEQPAEWVYRMPCAGVSTTSSPSRARSRWPGKSFPSTGQPRALQHKT